MNQSKMQNKGAYLKIGQWLRGEIPHKRLCIQGPQCSGITTALNFIGSMSSHVTLDTSSSALFKDRPEGEHNSTYYLKLDQLSIYLPVAEVHEQAKEMLNFVLDGEATAPEAAQTPPKRPGFANPDNWEPSRKDVRENVATRLICYHQKSNFGLSRLEAWHQDFGWPVGHILFHKESGRCIAIDDVYVIQGLRGTGISDKMLETIIAWAEMDDITNLTTARVNDFSFRFAERNGFAWTESQDCWIKPLVKAP